MTFLRMSVRVRIHGWCACTCLQLTVSGCSIHDISTYVCACTYLRLCVYIFTAVRARIYGCACTCLQLTVSGSSVHDISTYVCSCMRARVYVCVCVCVCRCDVEEFERAVHSITEHVA